MVLNALWPEGILQSLHCLDHQRLRSRLLSSYCTRSCRTRSSASYYTEVYREVLWSEPSSHLSLQSLWAQPFHIVPAMKKMHRESLKRQEQQPGLNADLSKFEVWVTFDNKTQGAATVYFNQSDGVLLSVLGSNRRYWGNDIKQNWQLEGPSVSLSLSGEQISSSFLLSPRARLFCCISLALDILDPLILLNGPLQLLNLHIILTDEDFTLWAEDRFKSLNETCK